VGVPDFNAALTGGFTLSWSAFILKYQHIALRTSKITKSLLKPLMLANLRMFSHYTDIVSNLFIFMGPHYENASSCADITVVRACAMSTFQSEFLPYVQARISAYFQPSHVVSVIIMGVTEGELRGTSPCLNPTMSMSPTFCRACEVFKWRHRYLFC